MLELRTTTEKIKKDKRCSVSLLKTFELAEGLVGYIALDETDKIDKVA